MNRYINHLTVHPLYRWLSARLQNFIANTLELLRSCTKPSIYTGHKPSQGCAFFMLTPRPSICKILIPPMFCAVSWAIIDSINRFWPCKFIPNHQLFYVTFVSKNKVTKKQLVRFAAASYLALLQQTLFKFVQHQLNGWCVFYSSKLLAFEMW